MTLSCRTSRITSKAFRVRYASSFGCGFWDASDLSIAVQPLFKAISASSRASISGGTFRKTLSRIFQTSIKRVSLLRFGRDCRTVAVITAVKSSIRVYEAKRLGIGGAFEAEEDGRDLGEKCVSRTWRLISSTFKSSMSAVISSMRFS